MMFWSLVRQKLVERKRVGWKALREVLVYLFLFFLLLQFLSLCLKSARSQPTDLLVFAEASSFARLDDVDPSGWFYQAVLHNPTESNIIVTGLRWWYKASLGVDFIDDTRNARCYDSRFFSNLPTVWVSPSGDETRWEYAEGTISLNVPAKEMIITWIEVPTNSRNNQTIQTTYYVEACVNSQWLSSPSYISHSSHDKLASTVFRSDFNLTTDPKSEKQDATRHNLQTPEWLFNEDRLVTANLSTRVRVIPVTSSRNTDGIDCATVNVTFPFGWSYVPGSAYNPYSETLTLYSDQGKDRLKWDIENSVQRYFDNQSMAQNYIEFNLTAPQVPGIHRFTVTSAITSLGEAWVTVENQSLYVVVRTPPKAAFAFLPKTPRVGDLVTFQASGSYDLDGSILAYTWNFGDSNTTTVTSTVITHVYETFGNYSVVLNVTDNDSLCDSSNLTLTVHKVDVAIVNVTVLATAVYVGEIANISVVVRNEGTANETFNVTLYYDNNSIGTLTVVDLEPGKEATLSFGWNTTGVTPGATYEIIAKAIAHVAETETVDNTYSYGVVKVRVRAFEWGPILPYLVSVVFGAIVVSAVGVLRKKRNTGEGFEFFDELTEGGIPDTYSVMIMGGASSGKSVMCQQLAYEHLKKGKSCFYITYDVFPSEVRRNMNNFGWGTSKYEGEGNFLVVDCYSPISGPDGQEKHYVEQPFTLSDLGITVSTVMGEVKQKPTRVFLDSTAPLFSRLDPAKVIEFLQDRSARIKGANGAFLFTVGKGTISSSLMSRLEEIVDCIIELDVHKEKTKNWKRIRIRKMRGRRVADLWIPLKIEAKKGIILFPPRNWERSREG